jgi:hypothetical protein
MALVLFLPLHAAVRLSLQITGPAHTHDDRESVRHLAEESWRPLNLVFRHRTADVQQGLQPQGFEWAATLRPVESTAHPASASWSHGHDERHATARHHHATGDPTVMVETPVEDVDGSAGTAGTGQGGAGLMAWATPSEPLRWVASASVRPEAAAATPWRDAVPRPPERPPRAG